MIALVAALPQETAPCLRSLDIHETMTDESFTATRALNHHSELLLVHGGFGRKSSAAVRWVATHFPVTSLISFGTAGGTSPLAGRGDIVIATEVVAAMDGKKSLAADTALTDRLSRSAERAGLTRHVGPTVTVNKVIADPQDKAFIGAEHRALSLDMESYWIGMAAAELKIPFGVVRSIFDPVEMGIDLPAPLISSYQGIWKYPRIWPRIPRWVMALRTVQRNLAKLTLFL